MIVAAPPVLTRRALAAGCLAGWSWPTAQAQEAAQDVRLAASAASFVLAAERIGEGTGLWLQHGLRPAVSVMDSGAAALSALIGGSAAFSVNAPSETLAARARGQDVVIVANLYAGQAASLLISAAAADRLGVPTTAPLAERLRALAGLVIAVPSPTSAPLGPIRAAAESAGVTLRLTYMAQGAMPAALETGAIGGMIAAFPFVATVLLRGTGRVWINGPGNDLPATLRLSSSATVQTSAAFLRAQPGTVRRLQQAVAATARFIEADRAGARRALTAAYPSMSAAELDLAFEQQWRNWTVPFLTEADIRREIAILASATRLAGLDTIDPASMLAGPV